MTSAERGRDPAQAFAADQRGLIRRARQLKGLTQRELGELLGLSQSAVSRLESSPGAPTPDLLPRIAAVLELPADALSFVLVGADAEQCRQWIWSSRLTPNEKLLLAALLDSPQARSELDMLMTRTGLGAGTVRSLTDKLTRDGLLRREVDRERRITLLALAARPSATTR
ncbi:MAG: helix-turn-helix domain-containing protein [Thiohalocapsa sp.]|nr:helix-turn-helix domain-containing protein [Thiohalocapsa sp.]MCF7990929.1 helix-turn-helix domain-containing protein [Thiohalocapsa sp.]